MDEEQPLLRQETDEEQNDTKNSQQESTSIEGIPDRITFLALLIGAFISMACESVVTSTHQQIASTFNASQLGSWLLTSYALGYSVVLPVYGNLIDIYGCRTMLLFAYCTFAIGCLITGCGPSIQVVLAGRFITSFGGAGMVDAVSILLNNTSALSQMAMLRTYLNIMLLVGASCGAPIGGMLMDSIGWRWSFIIQAPIALLCLAIVAVRLDPGASKDTPDSEHNWLAELAKIDYLGYILQLSTIACGAYGLYLIGTLAGEKLQLKIATGTGFLVLIIAFMAAELYTTKAPIFPIRSAVKDGIGLIYLGQVLIISCQFAFITNLSGFFIYTESATNTVASIPLILSAAGAILGSSAAGIYVKRFESCKIPSLTSAALALVGSILIFLRWRYVYLRWEVGYTILLCVGLGGLSSTQYIALAGRASGNSASVITSYHVCQQIGTIIGNEYPVALLMRNFRDQLVKSFGHNPEGQELIQRLLRDSKFLSTLKGPVQDQVRSAFLKSFPIIPGLCIIGLILFTFVELQLDDIFVQ